MPKTRSDYGHGAAYLSGLWKQTRSPSGAGSLVLWSPVELFAKVQGEVSCTRASKDTR